ncbi:hypothetical protein IID19_03605, partial [Patescibacteria group bacterium]|nr:hypothetical protein [Patescibacteria group bacterium]
MNNNQHITKYLLILLISSVAGAGIYGYVNFVQDTPSLKKIVEVSVEEVIDPELILDKMVQDSAKNYSKQFNEEDLTETYEFRMRNVQYLADSGEYEEIDNTIVASKSDYQYENTTNVFKTYFKNNPQDDEAIRFQVAGNRGVTLSFIDSNQSVASVEGNVVTYSDLYNGIDARYTVGGDLFLEEFIVLDATGVSSIEKISQKLKLNAVYYKEQIDGSITFYDTGTKNIVFVAPRPVMYEVQKEDVATLVEPLTDSLEDPEVQEPDINDERVPVNYDLHYEITYNGDELIIRKVLDEAGKAWLENANFPLVVDATFTFPTFGTNVNGEVWRSCNDSSCSSYTFAQNFVSNPALVLTQVTKQWTQVAIESITGKRRTHLYFATADLQFVPEDSIVFAQLRVSGFPYYTSGLWFMPAGYSDVQVYSERHPYFTSSDTIQQWFDKVSNMTTLDGTFSTSDSIPTRSNWTQSYCESNPSACTHTIDISPSSVSLAFAVSIGLREDAIPHEGHVNDWNWHGAKIFSTLAINDLEPVLTVTVLTKPTISIQTPLYSEFDRLDIDITDVSDNEDSWELERSLDGVSSWTNVCTATTGASGSCGASRGSYDCSGTSTAGTGGICTITDYDFDGDANDLIGDTLYYYRARAQIISSSLFSAYSSVKNDRTSAHVVNFTELVGSSPAWDEIEVTGGFNYPLVANQTDGSTKYNIIIYGNFTGSGYSERYNGDFTGTIAPIVEPFATSPHNRVSVGSIPWVTWVSSSYFGISGGGIVTLTGDPDPDVLTAPYPNRDFYVGESAQDTRSPNYMHDMSILDLTNGIFYSRARDPSPPTRGTVTANSIEVTMNISPSTSPATTHLNPSNTEYAMSVEDINTGEIKWFGIVSQDQSFTGSMPEFPNWGDPPTYWDNNNPRRVNSLTAATCYRFQAISRNVDGLIGEDVDYGFPASIPDDYDFDTLAVTYPFTDVCTTIYPPSEPDVTCGYNLADGYFCDVTINDTLNPSPPYYYKIERSNDGSSGWTAVQGNGGTYNAEDWSLSFQNGAIARMNSLTCDAASSSPYFRVSASLDGDDANSSNSSPSVSGTDTLPPCQPQNVEYDSGFQGSGKGPDYLDWTWTVPASGEAIDHYALTDTVDSSNSDDMAGIPTFRQSALSPNTRHIVNIQACDTRGRCGAISVNSAEQYTRAAVPTYTVACNYNIAPDNYYCNLDLIETLYDLVENPAGTKYLVQYCQPDNGDNCISGSVDWKNIVPLTDAGFSYFNSLGWFAKDWTGFEDFPFEDDVFSHVTCSVGNTTQKYRIRVRNEQSEELGGFFFLITTTDTLPPCQPKDLGQTSHTTSSMLWGWSAPINETEQPVQDYSVSYSSCTTGTNSNVSGTIFNQTGTTPNRFCAVSVRARESAAGGRLGRAASANGYTSIEGVSNITFSASILTKDIIGVTAIPAGAAFSNLLDASSGVQFQETTGTSGGGGDLGFTDFKQSDSVIDRSLQTNRQYCYQARSCNGNCSAIDGTGDINAYGPATPVCQYTLADTPAPP